MSIPRFSLPFCNGSDVSGLQLMRLLAVLGDDVLDHLSESRRKSRRLVLDLFEFITLEGISSAEFLDAGDSPVLIRCPSEQKDA